ncbi:MAG: hypothetical protein KKG93_09510 [Bacteroidetes bacterium]|nr:hypothetical protein [Bacteroidota bacterium]
MEISYKDRSEFLRGFLILIRKDKIITIEERTMALIIGNYLGFAKDFCTESLDNLLKNEYISEEPPLFSNSIIANYFVRESFRIVDQIHILGEKEIRWITKTAKDNNCCSDFLSFRK